MIKASNSLSSLSSTLEVSALTFSRVLLFPEALNSNEEALMLRYALELSAVIKVKESNVTMYV